MNQGEIFGEKKDNFQMEFKVLEVRLSLTPKTNQTKTKAQNLAILPWNVFKEIN